MTRTFVALPEFEKNWEQLGLDQMDQARLEQALMDNPNAGDMMQGTHGCRKVRIPLESTGKSGGARVIYVDFIRFEKIYLLTVYPKTEKENLTKQERNQLSIVVKKLEKADRESYERRG